MTKFMVLYKAPTSAAEMMASSSPEEAQAGMAAWMAWSEKVGEALIDFGSPLADVASLRGGTAGEGESQATGFSVLDADSRDTVVGLLEDHPHLQMPGASIDVLEFLPVPGM
ncbi:MAG TPA: hypothetical protein VGJ86_19320 [Acidimicrobiales bacterium]|jgi:hypothetical protein